MSKLAADVTTCQIMPGYVKLRTSTYFSNQTARIEMQGYQTNFSLMEHAHVLPCGREEGLKLSLAWPVGVAVGNSSGC